LIVVNLCFFAKVMSFFRIFIILKFNFVDSVNLVEFIFENIKKLCFDVLLIPRIVGRI
jgi:hypothetical protein